MNSRRRQLLYTGILLATWFVPLSVSIFAQGKEDDFDPFSEEAAKALARIQQGEADDSQKFLAPGQVRKLNELAKPSIVVIRQISRDGKPRGTGSGFVVSEDGLVVTNLHVIGEGRPIEVEFADGTVHRVTGIHASDRRYDLAVLKIGKEGDSFIPLKVADSSKIEQGDLIVGFGAPQGLGFSVVPGVISAVRKLDEGFIGEGETPEYPMLQLAMPIEQGNSGGPVLNLKGEVLGVVTLRHRVTENLGFAVQSSDLQMLLDKPNPVPMERWQTIGRLDQRRWEPIMGGGWSQRGGVIQAGEMGDGFGGRTVCLSSVEIPEEPYEVAVKVLLDDESGAAGLVFASDGGEVHYGFYPSGGKIRLTRFEGADVYSWSILEQIEVPSYVRGDWNRLRVRVEADTITGWVNGEKILELNDDRLRGGRAGLCKFRRTFARFRNFAVGPDLSEPEPDAKHTELFSKQIDRFIEKGSSQEMIDNLSVDRLTSAKMIRAKAEELEAMAANLRALEESVFRNSVAKELLMVLDRPESEIDLFEVGLQIARSADSELELDHYRDAFSQLTSDGAEYVMEKAGEAGPLEKATALRDFLFVESGFHGSRTEYYHHANSYVNHVLDDREGLPITLSLVFVEIARRLNIPEVFGAPLPGKFMVGVNHGSEDAPKTSYIDVFEGGKILDRSTAARSVWELLGSTPPRSVFEPATGRDIAVRMLRNLVDLEINQKQTPRGAEGYLELLLAVDPSAGQERFQRALLRVQDDNMTGAREDLNWLLENQPPGINYERLEQFRNSLPEE